MSSAISAVLEKCDIYFNDCLISKEDILNKYLAFFANTIDPQHRRVGVALHTGSICFDIVALIAVAIGSLAFNLTTNDDTIAALQPGDMVMFNGQRYRWKGVERLYDKFYIALEQDGTGKNGVTVTWKPYEKCKHLILPYYGDSKITDGRGVKRKVTNREEFLSYIFGLSDSEIPTQIGVSAVVVAERAYFADVCKQIIIEYGAGKRVGLLDIVPASYYTEAGKEYQFGSNPTKTEPVIKVAGNLSTARELVLDKHGNRVVGILVSGNMIPIDGSAELADLLRRKTLKFAVVTSPLKSESGNKILEFCEDAAVFACTKEYLSSVRCEVVSANRYTDELSRQVSTIILNTVHPVIISGGLSHERYVRIRTNLLHLRQSEWNDEVKEEFIATAQGILNLMNTAIFSMSEMERSIAEGIINQTVKSPKARIEYLWEIAERAGAFQDVCLSIVDDLEHQYEKLLTVSPKADALYSFISEHSSSDVAIVVPKAYYADILHSVNPELYTSNNVFCVTPSRFEPQKTYDAVLAVGEFGSRKFDALQCVSTKDVYVYLYDCEERAFSFRKRKQLKREYDINTKIGMPSAKPDSQPEEDRVTELEMQQFASLDDYIEQFRLFDLRRIVSSEGQSTGNIPTSEVAHIGLFSSGEQIFFTKYYSAVVFDAAKGTVTEKLPSDLAPGDVLVFTKRDDYTKNIVDAIYERLLTTGRLSGNSTERYEKSLYWKEVLREYKSKNNLTYRDIARRLQELGSSLQEESIRGWLIEDSHIVGPRDKKTMEYIALLTHDPYLTSNYSEYHEACVFVRSERRKILKLIAKAITDKLMGYTPPEGSVLEIVYGNVEKLSVTRDLADISELSESVFINAGLVNRPITESEVLL